MRLFYNDVKTIGNHTVEALLINNCELILMFLAAEDSGFRFHLGCRFLLQPLNSAHLCS